MKNTVKLLLTLSMLLWNEAVWAQTFQATVNRTEVPQGETFLLTLETDDDKIKATPDLSVLEKDFTVYSVGNSFQSTYVNGVSSHSRQWQIVLMPKNAGQIEIPAIKLGNIQSKPITLNVASTQMANQAQKQTTQSQNAEAPKFTVDASVDNKNPYVQQQVNYSFRIYDSGGLYGEAPVIIDDGKNDWIVKSLGDPTVNSKVINGRQFREIEFKYALFPQKSGKLKLPQIEFDGYYLTKSRRGSEPFDDIFNSGFFKMGFSDMFATRNPVKLIPEPISIDVKPIPAANGGYWWLPASEVTLSAQWDDKNPTFRVGEAVSCSVYLKATGVIETQLPNLQFPEIEGVKQYPDKPIAMSSERKGEIISIKKFGNVFIPEQKGQITLPAISVDWYNVHTGQLEKAILPAQTINVLPSLNGEKITQSEAQTKPAISENELLKDSVSQENKKEIPSWVWIICAFIGGIIVSYFLFGFKKEKKLTTKDYAQKVEKAVNQENLKEIRDNLIAWGRQLYPEKTINNLEDVAKQSGSAFKKHLEILDKNLYGKTKELLDKSEFLKIFKEEQKRIKQKKEQKTPLPKLYK